MTLRLIPFAAALLVVACRTSEVPASSFSSDPHAISIPLTRFNPDSLALAQYSGVTEAQNFVIRDATSWNDLWQRIYVGQTPTPPLPTVDFTQEMVVAAAMGGRPTGGYDIVLTDATQNSTGIVIAVRASSPGAHCFTTRALTQPVDVARLAKSDASVRFEVTQQTVDCGS